MAVVRCTCDAPAAYERAAQLAGELGLPLGGEAEAGALILEVASDRIQLRLAGSSAGPVYCDFVGGAVGYRRRNPQAQIGLLRKAIGVRGDARPTVVDATAGLGRDAVMLTSIGCHVTAIERSPLITALLRDGLERAKRADGDFTAPQLKHGDARDYLRSLAPDRQPDVVYMDPMFPHRTKSAQVGKEMVVCRVATGNDDDAPLLLAEALKVARRVVVKRSLRAPALEGVAPSHAIHGTSVRFDVYLRQ